MKFTTECSRIVFCSNVVLLTPLLYNRAESEQIRITTNFKAVLEAHVSGRIKGNFFVVTLASVF